VELAGDVPQGGVHRVDAGNDRAFAAVVARAVVHVVPQHFDVEWVVVDDQRLQRMFDQRSRNLRRLQALREGLAPADEAVVGEQLDQGGAALSHPALQESEGLSQRALQHGFSGR
jgi:hypothetical protein